MRIVVALRLRELFLALLLHVGSELRRIERLAEKRYRLGIRRKVLLRIGDFRRRRARRANDRQQRERLHAIERSARAVASTSFCVFMIPTTRGANGTAYGVVQAQI